LLPVVSRIPGLILELVGKALVVFVLIVIAYEVIWLLTGHPLISGNGVENPPWCADC
jgi:hypothetical protein